MEDVSLFERYNFYLVSIFTFFAGLPWLVLGFMSFLFLMPLIPDAVLTLISSMNSITSFLDASLSTILIFFASFLNVYLFFKIGGFFLKTAKHFTIDIDNCWTGFSRLILKDAIILFLIGIISLLVGSSVSNGLNDLESIGKIIDSGLLLFIFSIPMILSIMFMFIQNFLNEKSIVAGYLLIMRCVIRMIILMITAYVSLMILIPVMGIFAHIAPILLILDGLSQAIGSCIIVIKQINEDRDSDNYYNSFLELEQNSSPLESELKFHDESIPNRYAKGVKDDEGYEWIEHPTGSDEWYWREQTFSQWQKY